MAERKATNITWQDGEVTRDERHERLGQRGATVWLTGLSGSGKTTIAVALEKALLDRGNHAYRLDGDNIRHGLNKDLGFSADDRTENIRRVGEVARLFSDAGTIAIASFISPYRADRARARALHEDVALPFIEVFVDCPLEVAEERDPKGLYKRARAGEIKQFTGLDAPYEAPLAPDVHLHSAQMSLGDEVEALIAALTRRGVLAA